MNMSDFVNYGGWAISEPLYEDIRNLLPTGGKILEFGSGHGTQILLKHYSVISVEDNPQWVGLAARFNLTENESRYIYAPLVKTKIVEGFEEEDVWYDSEILQASLEEIEWDFDLVLVDGPCSGSTHHYPHIEVEGCIGRSGLITFVEKNKARFQGKNFVVDDCEREHELKVAERIGDILKGDLELKSYDEDKSHAIIRC
tara:strand:+ start:1217 stop:1816 length:600 start_codon:yes stop_codon:yes gene_type:complete